MAFVAVIASAGCGAAPVCTGEAVASAVLVLEPLTGRFEASVNEATKGCMPVGAPVCIGAGTATPPLDVGPSTETVPGWDGADVGMLAGAVGAVEAGGVLPDVGAASGPLGIAEPDGAPLGVADAEGVPLGVIPEGTAVGTAAAAVGVPLGVAKAEGVPLGVVSPGVCTMAVEGVVVGMAPVGVSLEVPAVGVALGAAEAEGARLGSGAADGGPLGVEELAGLPEFDGVAALGVALVG